MLVQFTQVILFISLIQQIHCWQCDSDSSETSVEMNLYWLNNTNEFAVCNDGTSSGYFYSPGIENTTWLVYLSGGSWCYSEETCEERWSLPAGVLGYSGKDHMSSLEWDDTCSQTGIFDLDPELNPLANVNKVYVPYCTSDGYMGDIGASDATFGWNFRGQIVVRAVFDSLQKDHGMKKGDTIIFVGGSAGARGVMALSDSIREYIDLDITYLLILDSPYYISVNPYNSSAFAGFVYETQQIYSLVNATKLVQNNCGNMYKGSEWKCLFGEFRVPFLNYKYLLFAAQYDQWQLEHNLMTTPNETANPPFEGKFLDYANIFGLLTEALVSGLPQLSRRQDSSVLSYACYNHCVSASKAFWLTKSSHGVSESNATRHFISEETGRQWIDECMGFECGSGCN